MKNKVKVVGCGVSGLSVANTLLDKGFQVEIITEKLPQDTTSSKAAAIWFPYDVKPKLKVTEWSKTSYDKYQQLCNDNNSGVSMVSLTVIIKKESDVWWKNALPKNQIKKASRKDLPEGYNLGYIMQVPLIETQVYLDYLLNRFKSLNGQLTVKKLYTLKDELDFKSIVVNCTGLGSKHLVNDNTLYPVHGQIVKAKLQKGSKPIAADFTFNENGLAYIIPRNDVMILGGTAIKGLKETEPNPKFTKAIIERCKRLDHNLSEVEIISAEVGLRPGRSEIRLEKEGKIIHNYGHGGGGFTVSWGCAEDVLKLIENQFQQHSQSIK